MRAIVIALGNPLRHDDGVAHGVLKAMSPAYDGESRAVMQLTPEVAADIAAYDTVIFMDADVRVTKLSIEPLDRLLANHSFSPPALTHVASPEEIVQLSRALFGFAGWAFVCRIPADDLSSGEGLSRRTGAFAAEAAEELETLLRELRGRVRQPPDAEPHIMES